MRGAAVATFAAFGVFACGTFLAAPDESGAPDGGASPPPADGSSEGATSEGGSGTGSTPKTPPICPFPTCDELPTAIDDEPCGDDECTSSVSWAKTGTVDLVPDGGSTQCRGEATPGAGGFTSETREVDAPQRYAMISLSLVSAIVDGRAIAQLAIEKKEHVERVEAIVRNGVLFLCENGEDQPEACTSGAPFDGTKRIHLYGTMSTTEPTTFALAVDDCSSPQVLKTRRPFPTPGFVRMSVGCLAGPNACAIEWRASTAWVAAE